MTEPAADKSAMTAGEREKKIDALRRYEQLRREHLGAAANLTFALASAGVGFCASLVTGKDHPAWTSPGNYFFVIATALFLASVGLSMFLMWTRLQDFRLTADKLRLELRNGDAQAIRDAGQKADCYGKVTWGLYRSQIITFGAALACLIVSLWVFYGHCMFP